jgi:hypothetical protein
MNTIFYKNTGGVSVTVVAFVSMFLNAFRSKWKQMDDNIELQQRIPINVPVNTRSFLAKRNELNFPGSI